MVNRSSEDKGGRGKAEGGKELDGFRLPPSPFPLPLQFWVVALLVFAWIVLIGQSAGAAEPKTECPKECEMRAKAAFAFAKLKAEAVTLATAPMPKPVVPKGLCCCGDNCHCAPGDCPSKCPVAGVSGIAETVAKPKTLPSAPKRIVGYTCGIDQYGRRVCVPVYSE
jgi:hypothetical protein